MDRPIESQVLFESNVAVSTPDRIVQPACCDGACLAPSLALARLLTIVPATACPPARGPSYYPSDNFVSADNGHTSLMLNPSCVSSRATSAALS